MFATLFERWGRSSTFSDHEMRVLRELLPTQSPYTRTLLSQAAQAPYIERRVISDSEFESVIPYVIDDSLLIECGFAVRSPELEVVDATTGRQLRFFTEILRGGFLRGLSGYAIDGNRWPKRWKCHFDSIKRPSGAESWLDVIPVPPESSYVAEKLAEWCGVSSRDLTPEQRGLMRFAAPANDVEIQMCEDRLNLRLNEQYRELLRITNGFSIYRGRPYEVLGTSDVGFVGGSMEWVGITPLYEEGYVAMKVDGECVTRRCFFLSLDGATDEIGDCKSHVRDSLLWED